MDPSTSGPKHVREALRAAAGLAELHLSQEQNPLSSGAEVERTAGMWLSPNFQVSFTGQKDFINLLEGQDVSLPGHSLN